MKKAILSSSLIVLFFVAAAGCGDATTAPAEPETRTESEALNRAGAAAFGGGFGGASNATGFGAGNVAVSLVADACTVGKRTIDATCDHIFVEAFPITARAWSLNQWAPEGNLHVRQGGNTRIPNQYVKACLCPAGAADLYHPGTCSQPLVPVDGYSDANGEIRTNMPYSTPNATGDITDPVHVMRVNGWSSLVSIDVAGTPTLVECHHGASC